MEEKPSEGFKKEIEEYFAMQRDQQVKTESDKGIGFNIIRYRAEICITKWHII